MTRARLRLRRQLDTDGGFTLSELLVVIVLFAIIGGIVGTVVRVGLTHQTQMQARNAAFADARKVIQRIDRDIRGAYPLGVASTANPNGATTATSISMDEVGPTGTTSVVTYLVTATSPTKSQLTYYACATCTGKVLVTDLVQTSTSPVFSFAPTTDFATLYPSQTATDATTCTFTATPTQYDPTCVGTITVHLMVQPSSINAPVSISDSGTEIRNAT